jgi:hypothetical protein
MDVPADRGTRTTAAAPQAVGRGRRRRRPTGEPPPLPHHLQTSGIRWLVATAVLVVLRRFRHVVIWLVVATLLALIASGILGQVAQRPRPFGSRSGRAGAAGRCRRSRSPSSPPGW